MPTALLSLKVNCLYDKVAVNAAHVLKQQQKRTSGANLDTDLAPILF